MIEWIPELVLFEQASGIWQKYLDLLYSYYASDFIDTVVYRNGTRIGIRKYPFSEGKEKSFWHLVSNGEIEEERQIDFRRCERIRWPRPVIEHSECEDIWIWNNQRGSEKRLLLYLHEERYLVVLGIRNGYFLLCTAYYVEQEHRHEQLRQEYELFAAAQKARAASCEAAPNTPSTPGR